MLRKCSLLLGVMLAQASWAGQVTLKNGDIVEGSLAGVNGGNIIWTSDQLGDLELKKEWVDSVISTDKLKIRGTEEPCTWSSMGADRAVVFTCEDGTTHVISLMSLKNVVPYKGHAEANYEYNGNVRASGWKQTGNTESEYWELVTGVRMRHGDLRHVLDLAIDIQETESEDANGQPVVTEYAHNLAIYALDWFFSPKVYWANRVSAETDEARNIQEEYTAGSGLGYQFWENDITALALELGLEYSRTYLDENPPIDEPEDYTSLRFSTDYRYKFKSGPALYHVNEFTQALNEDEGKEDRWKIRTDTGVSFPIGYGVSADISVRWDYVNYALDLDPTSSKSDTIVRAGVNYSW